MRFDRFIYMLAIYKTDDFSFIEHNIWSILGGGFAVSDLTYCCLAANEFRSKIALHPVKRFTFT